MANLDVQQTLSEAVAEVLHGLTGLDLEYEPAQERFHSTVRAINRALRDVALEHEWSYYSSTEEIGQAASGVASYEISQKLRPRVINDDAVRLLDEDGNVRVWAYMLPRDALHKYGNRQGLWCSFTRSTLLFSRPTTTAESGLRIVVPVMREPRMFRLPGAGRDIPRATLSQLVDFDYPDLVVAKAMELLALTDPVMQPRVQTLTANYKDRMYQLIERDDRHTDAAYVNEIIIPMEGRLGGSGHHPLSHGHPHSDEGW